MKRVVVHGRKCTWGVQRVCTAGVYGVYILGVPTRVYQEGYTGAYIPGCTREGIQGGVPGSIYQGVPGIPVIPVSLLVLPSGHAGLSTFNTFNAQPGPWAASLASLSRFTVGHERAAPNLEGGLRAFFEGLGYSCMPCAGVLSVAGFLVSFRRFPG